MSIAYSFNPHRVVRAGYGIFYDTGATQVSNNVGNAIYGTSSAVNYNVNNVTLGTPLDTPVLKLANTFPSPLSTTLGSFPVPTGKGQGYDGDGQLAQITYFDQKSEPLPYYQRMLLDVQQQVGDVATCSRSPFRRHRAARERMRPTSTYPPYQTGWTYGGGNGDPTFDAATSNNAGQVWRHLCSSAESQLVL